MNNNAAKQCVICGAPCKNKYCSEECGKEAVRRSRRQAYRKQHPATENFYVFYDKDDFVECCGTEEQLVADKIFPSISAIRSRASKHKAGKYKGNVLILKCRV